MRITKKNMHKIAADMEARKRALAAFNAKYDGVDQSASLLDRIEHYNNNLKSVTRTTQSVGGNASPKLKSHMRVRPTRPHAKSHG